MSHGKPFDWRHAEQLVCVVHGRGHVSGGALIMICEIALFTKFPQQFQLKA